MVCLSLWFNSTFIYLSISILLFYCLKLSCPITQLLRVCQNRSPAGRVGEKSKGETLSQEITSPGSNHRLTEGCGGCCVFPLVLQKEEAQDPARDLEEGPIGVKGKTLRSWGTALGSRNETLGPDSSVSPAEYNSVSFPKFLVNLVSDTLGCRTCHRGWADACPRFSIREIISGTRILKKQKSLLADNMVTSLLPLNRERGII